MLELFKLETNPITVTAPATCDRKRSRGVVDSKGHLVRVYYKARKQPPFSELPLFILFQQPQRIISRNRRLRSVRFP